MKATACGPSNIALVKYWGKRDAALNIPATGSISVTLDGLETQTTVQFDASLAEDACLLNGAPDAKAEQRVRGFLALVRRLSGIDQYARVETENNFPTGAGLASSASGFAALAVACDAALGLGLTPPALSALARRGSGSAARSLIDGFAEMRAGSAADGSDAYAVALGGVDLLPMDILAVVTTRAKKGTSSTEGMVRTAETSPYYAGWVKQTQTDLVTMREALGAADFDRVGRLAEENALRMHAVMLGSSPSLLYWNGVTVDVIQAVWAARADGARAWVTIDAGPQVKVLCAPGEGEALAALLGDVPGVLAILPSRPGRGARVLEARA